MRNENSALAPGTSPHIRFWLPDLRTAELRALLLFIAMLAALVLVWDLVVRLELVVKLAPSPAQVARRAAEILADPFFSRGVNNVGIGWHVFTSLQRVMAGFGLAVLVAVPLGFAIGLSPLLARATDPFIQVLKPVSPLAWLPIGLAMLGKAEATAIFVIFMSSLWPLLLNTIAGVRAVPRGYFDLARILEARRWVVLRRIVLPAALPNIVVGLRIALGIAWLVIVAAEMLVGGRGIGYFLWNEWNNLNVASIAVAILLIGTIGLALDRLVRRLEQLVSHE